MAIKVKNWEVFQHYKNRRPPWIRLYRDLLDDPEYHALTGDQAKALMLLWLIASEDEMLQGNLPNVQKLAFRLRISENEMINIIHGLSHWLEFDSDDMLASCYQDASKPLATCLQHAIPESESDPESEGDQIQIREQKKITATRARSRSNGKGIATWEAYSKAYEQRYGTKPVRNAKINRHCCQLVDKLGEEEAPLVAAYYLTVRNSYHVSRGHSLQCLVGDAEKIRTEWATGVQITQTKANEEDRLEKRRAGWQKIIDECEPD